MFRLNKRVIKFLGDFIYNVFFFKQKTAYEMCGRDWSSDVCSSDLPKFTLIGATPSVGRCVSIFTTKHNPYRKYVPSCKTYPAPDV